MALTFFLHGPQSISLVSVRSSKRNRRSPLLLRIPPSRAAIFSWVQRKNSAPSGDSFAGNEVVASGLGVRLDRSQVGASNRRLSRLHFDFSERETRIEFEAQIAQLSRLRDDGGQLFACRLGGRGVGMIVSSGLNTRCSDGSLPTRIRILALGRQGSRM